MTEFKRRLLVSHIHAIGKNALITGRGNWFSHVSPKYITAKVRDEFDYPFDELLVLVEEQVQIAKLEALLEED